MKIHEYQAKEILAGHGVPVPRGMAVTTARDAKRAATDLGGKVVVKAQIHAGGRGKGRLVASQAKTAAMYQKLEANPKATEGAVKGGRVGGVRLADSAGRAQAEAAKILGKYLVTHQTGPNGKKVQRLLIEEQFAIADEYYAAVLVDSTLGTPILIVSTEGGQAIEEVAAHNPKAIIRMPIDPVAGFPAFRGRQLAKQLKMPQPVIFQAGNLFAGLYRAFLASDASMAEINPFVITTDNRILAVDAKLSIDDNAAFRQPTAALRDKSEEDPMEILAEEAGIGSYIKLDGNIGCMVNGAGLAMATMDTIMLAGGEPANFLDIGTVNRVELVVNAVHIINLDPNVRAILVNIFGGMARVDVVAEGLVMAVKKYRIKHPIVARLNGSNVEEGRRIIEASGLDFILADDLGEAARKAVKAAG
jgi:succinyl-CoA synthetase beta subunit